VSADPRSPPAVPAAPLMRGGQSDRIILPTARARVYGNLIAIGAHEPRFSERCSCVPEGEAPSFMGWPAPPRRAAAPDYWKLNPFYVSQTASSDCSVASVAMAINFMLGLPGGAEEPIVRQASLLT
jgi:hypothetical protein